MIPSERDAIIQQLLAQRGIVTVAQICAHCNCSPETARRDLRRLEERGELFRTHGGAITIDSQAPRRPTGGGLIEARIALADRADVLIVTPSDTKATHLLVEQCKSAGIPIIAESKYYPGAVTVISTDNYQAGREVGQRVAEYANRHFDGQVVALDVSYPQSNTEARSRGFADGLHQLPAGQRTIISINGMGLFETARQITADALDVHPEINVIFGINDDSTLGALEAYQAAGLDESKLLLVLFGLEGDAAKDLLERGQPYTISVAMFPELVGRACVDAAVCAYGGYPIPECIATPYAIVTPKTLHSFYYRDERTGGWRTDWSRVEQLQSGSAGFSMLGKDQVRRKPRRIGYIGVFSSHAWYQNLRSAMQMRSRASGAILEMIDASQDMDQEVDALRSAIGKSAAQFVNAGDTIILDAGTTTAYLARALRGREGITVITNSLRVLAELKDEAGITLVSSGGIVRKESQSLVDSRAEAAFQHLRVDKAFVSTTGLSLEFGLSNTNMAEAAVKRAMIAAARETILLADSSKLGVESLVRIAPVEKINHLITDSAISSRHRLALAQKDITVTIAEEAPLVMG